MRMKTGNPGKGIIVLSLIVSGIVGCRSVVDDSDLHSTTSTPLIQAKLGEAPSRIELPQGWSHSTRESFWFTSQGSQIIPYSWFLWLEQAQSTDLYRDSENMELLRYLPMNPSAANPDGLPIGFVKALDRKSGESWVGVTCAACHTNQLDYQGKKLLIEGGPTLANFVMFFSTLVDALNATRQDEAKFLRFAKNVLAENYNPHNKRELRAALTRVALAAEERIVVNRLPPSYPDDFTSYARLDAFGNIQNAGTAFALNDLSNRNYPTGPVSYPFLWGTHQSDVVQWNASAPNSPRIVGPLARNVGEVVGVFGNLSIKEAPWWERLIGIKVRYSANVDFDGLGRLEAMVKTLRSPQWPEQILPTIDTQKAAVGAELYAKRCASCHQVVAREDEGEDYVSNKTPVHKLGTDPATAWNADRRCAQTLALEGVRKSVLFGKKFGSEAAAISIPVNGAVGVILRHPKEAIEAGLRPIRTRSSDMNDFRSARSMADSENALDQAVAKHDTPLEDYVTQHVAARNVIAQEATTNDDEASCGDPDAILVYKGRPLNGIWATAPYLHNGSVPDLWSLLQKGEDRPASFWVGSREFDPVKVGYQTSQGLNEFRVNDDRGNIQPGNSNRGHEYGATWSDEQKWAVIEYMKTL